MILRGGMMKTVVLEVRSTDAVMNDFVRAWQSGISESEAHISFATPELLWRVRA